MNLYGVWAEPIDHDGKPQWISMTRLSYDDALQTADAFNKYNACWKYSVREFENE